MTKGMVIVFGFAGRVPIECILVCYCLGVKHQSFVVLVAKSRRGIRKNVLLIERHSKLLVIFSV